MSFLDTLNQMIEGKKITRPIFTKDFEAENSQLRDLIELSNRLKQGSKKEMVDRDIAYLKYGLEGEKNVYFELKNSFLPILCLHDIRLEYGDYVAQFDFIVISNKFICILETKKLNGDIEITRDGDFIRTIKGYDGRFIKKEGMYSPISQNERHLNILCEILVKEKLIVALPIKSLVVMANPKTILNKVKCPASIQKSIYKYDQVSNFLKGLQNDKTNDKNHLEKFMYQISDYLVKNNKPLQMDYHSKYGITNEDYLNIAKNETAASKEESYHYKSEIQSTHSVVKETMSQVIEVQNSRQVIKNSAETIVALKKYRLEVSRLEGLKPYMVFSDKEMENLIEVNPRNKKELLRVKGFAEKKVTKYGDQILQILNR